MTRRPPQGARHDELWMGPIGRGRKARYRSDFPDQRCVSCLDPHNGAHIHHLHYRQFTGMELDKTFRYLCPTCHRAVHRLHDRLFGWDRWPYRFLGLTTKAFVAKGWLYRWATWGRHPLPAEPAVPDEFSGGAL
jgi:hypothetical protein